jgi:hypothetical protein
LTDDNIQTGTGASKTQVNGRLRKLWLDLVRGGERLRIRVDGIAGSELVIPERACSVLDGKDQREERGVWLDDSEEWKNRSSSPS